MLLEYLFVGVVGPEAPFERISFALSSIASPHFRKFILETSLREFPHLYCVVVQNCLMDGLTQLDRPLRVLANNASKRGQGRLLFALVAHNAPKLIRHLTELNKQGDILVGEKMVGGDCCCVYIPALIPLKRALEEGAGIACNLDEFL